MSSDDPPPSGPSKPPPGVETAPDARAVTTPTGPPPPLDAPLDAYWPAVPTIDPAGRYRFECKLARGGQGEIWSVRDTRLDRVLAVKVMGDTLPGSPDARAAFAAEQAFTVRLSHPGVVPVFDAGELDDGRPWFAMKQVEGRHFGDVMADARARAVPAHAGRRLVATFARVCEAVAFAHEQGVVHGDLKPQNIMVGPFGEIYVMDWGLARAVDDPRAEIRPSGTPGYMAPECWDPDARPAPPRDVYALGGVLHALLVGRRPAPLTGWTRDAACTWPDGSPGPAELAAIGRRAMARDPAERPPDAGALHAELMAWLDGARRREEALSWVDRARAIRPEIEALRHTAAERRRRAAELLGAVPAHAPAADKLAGWALEDEAAEAAATATLHEVAFEQALNAALLREPGLPEARALLAEHYRAALLAAEATHDLAAADRWAALLRAQGTPRDRAWLESGGTLRLVTDPRGARVTRHPLVARQRRLERGDGVLLGHTPLTGVALPRGSHLLVIDADGCAPLSLPIHIERGEAWHAQPPGPVAARPLRLPPLGALAPDEALVPAGWFLAGGDPAAPDALPRRRLWVDDVVFRRLPVTHREYAAFLDDIGPALAHAHVPRARAGDDDGAPIYRFDGARWTPGQHAEGDPIDPEWPVCLVSWHDAMAYAAWYAARTGLDWRLPHDLEWEKAARGVDGRHLPWGDHFEPSWALVLEGFAGRPGPAPVGAYPTDVSVYGVGDLVGGVREWCIDDYAREGPPGDRVVVEAGDGPFRMVRGGVWSSKAAFCRPAARFANKPDQRFRSIGFRLARPWLDG